MQILSTAVAHATGDVRNGHARTDDGLLDLDLRVPKELGGPGGDATNPEQLFALGCTACFHSALKFVAARDKVDTTTPRSLPRWASGSARAALSVV